MLPVFNNNSAAGIAAGVNGTFCTIVAPTPQVRNQGTGQNSGPMIDLASYYILVGTAFTAGTITFYEQGADGVYRPLAVPAPIAFGALTLNASLNGVLNGPFHGLQIQIASSATGTIVYVELKGTVRSQ